MSDAISVLPNEEAVRAHVMLPFLQRLSLSPDQILVEKTLRLRLGHSEHAIRSDQATGRMDLLIRNHDGRNLFVVELKREDLPLTDEDRDQGISYARLLDQMPPFVLLTNGRESSIYDTLTREKLSSEHFAEQSEYFSGGMLPSPDDIRLRWEALRYFVGYSAENVKRFSSSQVASRIEPLVGRAPRAGKYIRELYVPRKSLRAAFEAFLAGHGTAFAIVGESGTGKSNEMCALAEVLAGSHVTLFMAARAVSGGPGQALVEDFSWGFSQSVDLPRLVGRISELADATSRPALVLIDGIDEAVDPTFPTLVSDLATKLRGTHGAVRLVVSAKLSDWPRFMKTRDTPSGLALALDESWRSEGTAPGDGDVARPFILGGFSEEELERAERNYQDYFGLSERPQGRLREHCHTPFFLRVVAETYADHAGPLPSDLSSSAIVRQWLDRKLDAVSDARLAMASIRSVGQAVFERAKDGLNSRQALANLSQVPESNLHPTPSSELVSHGVLDRSLDAEGRAFLSFHHDRVRDYVIARHVLQLDNLAADAFASLLPDLLANHVGQSILAWHLRDAPRSHVEALRGEAQGCAALFLHEYTRILDEVVPGVRPSLEPFTSGDIGLAYELDDFGLRSYGFFPVGEATEARVQRLEPTYDGSPWPFAGALVRLGGAIARGGGVNFTNADPGDAARQFALDRVQEAVAAGGLDESGSRDLLIEAILAICSEYRRKLALPRVDHHQTRLTALLPLRLQDLQIAIQAHFGAEFYTRQWVDQQVREETKFVTRHPGSTSYSVSYDSEALERLRIRAEREAPEGVRFPAPRVLGQGDLTRLPELLDRARGQGVDEIASPPLPGPDLLPPYGGYQLHLAYSDEAIVELIRSFFTAVLPAYRVVVERNFPMIKDRFRLYSRLPCTSLAAYYRPRPEDLDTSWGRLQWAICPTEGGETEPIVVYEPAEALFHREGASGPHLVSRYGHRLEFGFTTGDLRGLLDPYSPPGFGIDAKSSRAARQAPIRAFVYERIRRDLSEIAADDLLA